MPPCSEVSDCSADGVPCCSGGPEAVQALKLIATKTASDTASLWKQCPDELLAATTCNHISYEMKRSGIG